ncbi:phenylalanine--tRNA ligase beta subunit [Variibacter gotjawalensis]|uniref:Phenylalanine--tRNA ligase beta subunit n=1 Tax=Variibacter gotjawalensis TaxID=1333996 RepID=A0A0S3PV68_9BRAD|nr:phenylalanine--tRNA ligase subunit beta [Variibacter gotjawalensis]NIK50132.1 phenylalanyl-tRNA synthetase beta chain [Variibacter gotjawalensis]RZS46129.1 phenylalanyl-tRNA synthetase beta subunit [Variibacter gotjawalensis]BAT59805.1 phenylalanine--tRNA ligase beta subunit [Variibacter gotjawalensis]
MKFTLSWLKEHLDTDASLDKIVETLTAIGLEVENVEDPAKALAAFKIAYVVDAKQHPNADRLRVCMVDTGEGAPIQVVCGAPNARTGMKSVFSPPGTYIPGKKITLGIGKIRDVESRGMLVSEAEMELSDDHDGIIDLPDDAPVGTPYATYAKLDDPVIEINLTPNRPDATGVYGIARDLAAAGLGKLKDGSVKNIAGKFPCPVSVKLDFASTSSLCPAFALRLVKGVKNGPSPAWMQKRLKAIGLRPINALVDITNYVTFDRGRPLHVFDAAKVNGNLTVRRAKEGEELLALDGRTYKLDPSICVITDEKGVESLSGVMGGEETGCSDTTTDVLIESALWVPNNIAQTGRKLGINTDARYRFERGVDPAFNSPGAELATQLVIDLCGGEPSELIVVGDESAPQTVVDFPVSETKRLAGLDVPDTDARKTLEALGFAVKGEGARWQVTAPTWRPDVEGKADIVEEIMRIAGVDNIAPVPFERGDAPRKPVLTPIQIRTRKAKRALASRGMTEAVTWSFVSEKQAKQFGGGDVSLSLANPIAAELSDMRPSIIPGLASAAQKNSDRGFADVALFEVGAIFKGDKPEDQFIVATGVRNAQARASGSGRFWSGSAGNVDVYDAKADALAVLVAAGASPNALQIVPGGPAWFHPGRSGTIQIGPQNVLGHFGELHPKALEALGVDGPIAAFEVVLDRVPEAKKKPTRAKPVLDLSAFQPVERDFAFVVDRNVKAADILRAAQSAEKKLLAGISIFDVYEGTGVEPGKKSVAIAVTLQPREKTLTDQEIDAVGAKIVAEVSKRTGAVLRG